MHQQRDENSVKAISVRWAATQERAWVNARYAEVDFKPAGPDEWIAIAECAGDKAGIGRLVPASEHAAELGGMYVSPACRRQGVADRIVAFLLQHTRWPVLYCIPFKQVEGLYLAHGFKPVTDLCQVPSAVMQKFGWCGGHYPDDVSLLRWDRA